MPYSSVSEVPKSVPKDKRKQWMTVWNKTYADCTGDGGSKDTCETKAFRIANGVVKKNKSMNTFGKIFEDLKTAIFGIQSSLSNIERSLPLSSLYNQIAIDMYEKYPEMYMTDIYHDSDGSMFALMTSRGKLYRAPIEISEDEEVTVGDLKEVMVQFADKPTERFSIKRTAGGQFRWIGVSCTSILNKDAQIDSRDLFDSFAKYVERTKDYPYRTFYHKDQQFRVGLCDFVAREGYTLITSGLYDDSEIAKREVAARVKDPEYWGDSISYIPLDSKPEFLDADGIQIPIYRSGILLEISTLPEADASAYFTNRTVINSDGLEERQMNDKQKKAFLKLFDDDEEAMNKWLANNVDETNRTIEISGAIARASEDDNETSEEGSSDEESPDPEGTLESPSEQVIELDEEMLTSIIERASAAVLEAIGFEATVNDLRSSIIRSQQSIDELAERLAVLETPEDRRKQSWVKDLPRNNAKVRVSYRPSAKKPDNGDGDEEQSYANIAAATLKSLE